MRLYHIPPKVFLDDAQAHDLYVLIDVPWEKHRCFLEDWASQEDARARIRRTARELGNHPAVLAISVVNELPNDVVRFHGRDRLEKFVIELVEIVKQEAPDCLATFVNFPTTEFLDVANVDFSCFNVYLNDAETLGNYLDRLQHIAGNRPLLLGEYGICSLHCGEDVQSAMLCDHIREVFRRGLAGSFVFSYTDDWFTGGYQIVEWAFGVTRTDRSLKSSAAPLTEIWNSVPQIDRVHLPKVSVVVCSYNGSRTLEECLRSLSRLNYPDYEVILVDDGSRDQTPQIAEQFANVRYHRQTNLGLSVARNVGAELATGEVVAYTDDDCAADEDWLYYLMRAMQLQQVEAIGGPNVPPPSDGWIARCVAASPGGPSHVMLDDRLAEHIPGCNMAFRRDLLLSLGGFDPQFRQAGDDVDMCWRWLDAGYSIGYAPAALVWHHRRSTVRAYFRQQKGYGRSEAMVYRKHPQRFSSLGYSIWQGVIYGDGAVGLPTLPDVIYHGRFGSAPFQTIYRQMSYSRWAWTGTVEWNVCALFLVCLSLLYPALGIIPLLMWSMTLSSAARSTWRATLPAGEPWWSRPLVFWMYLWQPLIRGWHRHRHMLRSRTLPQQLPRQELTSDAHLKATGYGQFDIYWMSERGLGREQLLEILVAEARRDGWCGEFSNDWAPWDIAIVGDRWHDITLRTATEELGWPERFTRARVKIRLSTYGRAAILALGLAALTLFSTLQPGFQTVGVLLLLGAWVVVARSRQRCTQNFAELLTRCGRLAGLVALTPDGVPREKPSRHQPPAESAISQEDELVAAADV